MHLLSVDSLMAYRCLPLCGLFRFFNGFRKNLLHTGFQLVQIVSWPLHGIAENFLFFRVRQITLIVFEHSFPCVSHHFCGRAQGFVDLHALVRDLVSLELFGVGCGHRNRLICFGVCVCSFHRFRDLRVHDLGKDIPPFVRTALHELGHFFIRELHFAGKDFLLDAGREVVRDVNAPCIVASTENGGTADTVFFCDSVAGFLSGVVVIIVICSL